MKPLTTPLTRPRTPRGKQRGVVLFIALIALVVLTIGALALYRSTDSATAISGNVSYRQQGVAVSSQAIEAAKDWLVANGNPVEGLYDDIAGSGYYATMYQHTSDGDMLKFDWGTDWSHAKKIDGAPDGYQIGYVIHRLCPNTGTPVSCINANTTVAAPKSIINHNSGDVVADTSADSASPYYRITARALGPRNTESIVQVLAY